MAQPYAMSHARMVCSPPARNREASSGYKPVVPEDEAPTMRESTMKAKLGHFRGMMPIMATPVHSDNSLDVESQRRHVEYCLKCGAVAVGHFAYASEFKKLRERDRSRILEVVAETINGRVPFFAGVTAKTRADMLRYARDAEQRGADLIMPSLPYEEELDQEGALALFVDLASAVSLPMIIQDVPQTAHILTPDLVTTIADATGKVHSIKAESDDFLTKTAELMRRFEGTMQVIGGAGGRHMIHLLRLGVTAFMTGTEALELHASVVNAYLRGQEDEAAELYFNKILPYLMFYGSDNWLRNLKMMLHMRGIIDSPNLCLPDDDIPPPHSPVVMEQYLWVLNRIGWMKTWPDIP